MSNAPDAAPDSGPDSDLDTVADSAPLAAALRRRVAPARVLGLGLTLAAGVHAAGTLMLTLALAALLAGVVVEALPGVMPGDGRAAEVWPAGVFGGLSALHLPPAGWRAVWPDGWRAGVGSPGAAIVLLALAALGLALRALGAWSRDTLASRRAFAVETVLRRRLRTQIDRAGPLVLARVAPPGEVVARYQRQVERVHAAYASAEPAAVQALVMGLAVLAVVFALDWLAGLLLALAAPLIPMFMALIGMGAARVHEAQQAEEARLGGHFVDRVQAAGWLRRAGAESVSLREVAQASEGFRRLTLRVLRVAFLSSAVLEFFAAAAIGLVAIYIGFALFGAIDYGPALGLSLFTGLWILLLAPEYFAAIRHWAERYHDRADAATALAALAAFERELRASACRAGHTGESETTDDGVAAAPAAGGSTADHAVVMRDVTFTPPGRTGAVLSGFSLAVAPGEIVALVGPSGAGKSTVLGLVAGFLEPDSGSVARSAAARRFVWIGQSLHLYAGRLRDALTTGLDDVHGAGAGHFSDAQLCDALAAAGLDPALEGWTLERPLGELGVGVSGGQAERIALARGYLRPEALWLLDEPTRALDPATRDRVIGTLFARARASGWTLIVATHDPELAERADRVVALDEVSMDARAGTGFSTDPARSEGLR